MFTADSYLRRNIWVTISSPRAAGAPECTGPPCRRASASGTMRITPPESTTAMFCRRKAEFRTPPAWPGWGCCPRVRRELLLHRQRDRALDARIDDDGAAGEIGHGPPYRFDLGVDEVERQPL